MHACSSCTRGVSGCAYSIHDPCVLLAVPGQPKSGTRFLLQMQAAVIASIPSPAVLEWCLDSPGSYVLTSLAGCVGRAQFLCPCERRTGSHVEMEDTSWTSGHAGEG